MDNHPTNDDNGSPNRAIVLYLTVLRNWASAYHNHKENAGWGAISLGVALSTGLIVFSYDEEVIQGVPIFLIVLVIALLVQHFVSVQRKNRIYAFHAEAACDRLINQALGGHQFDEDERSFEDESKLAETALKDFPLNYNRLPRCLHEEIEHIKALQSEIKDIRGKEEKRWTKKIMNWFSRRAEHPDELIIFVPAVVAGFLMVSSCAPGWISCALDWICSCWAWICRLPTA